MPAGLNSWTYSPLYQGPSLEIDPRALIARHIGWTKPHWISKQTSWSTPEPDNFSLAIYDLRAHECSWLINQVFIKYRQGWITCYYCPAESIMEWRRWQLYEVKPWATWKSKHMAIRESHTLLTLGKRRNSPELTEHELLYSMNNYEKLKERTDFPELIDQRVGLPTDQLKEYLATLE